MAKYKVYVVFRVHGGPEVVDCDTVLGVFRKLEDAKACLGNEYRVARPDGKWIFSEDQPEINDFMHAEIVQTDGDFDRFGIIEQEVR